MKVNRTSDFPVHEVNQASDFPVHNTARICYNERLIFKTRLNSNLKEKEFD